MNKFDSNGWDSIHSAAYKGFIASLEKLIEKYPEKLELTTMDELCSTPFLLAVMSGNLDTVRELIKLGAQIHTRNSQGHGIIEIICLRKDIDMLTFFLDSVDEETLPVWVHLVDFMVSNDDEESIRASYCINEILTLNKLKENRLPYEEKCIEADIVSAIIKVNKGEQAYECKKASLIVLLHIIIYQVVRESFINNGGLEALLPLLRPPSNPDIARLVIEILDILIAEPDGFSEKVYHSGAISDVNKILEWSAAFLEDKYYKYEGGYEGNSEEEKNDSSLVDTNNDSQSAKQLHFNWYKPDLLKEIVQLLGNLVEINQAYQNNIGREPNFFHRLGILFTENEHRSLLIELTKCVAKLAKDNNTNQCAFMKINIEDYIINLIRAKDQTIRLAAVDATINLTKDNIDYQNLLMAKGGHKPLLIMLRKSGRNIVTDEKASYAIWSLSGQTRDSKAEMASLIGVDLLIHFLQTPSNILQLIGSEAIYVLSGGPSSQRDVIGKKNGIQALVNLLKSSNIDIVLSSIRSLRQLCVKLGFVPHIRNQQLLILTRGLQTMVDLMRYCEDELVQVESAFTIAAASMRNEEALAELHSNPKFNYVYILEKMYSSQSEVRLLAGASLAAFAYNNLTEQKKMAMYGGVRFKCLKPFLFSENEYERCMSAFQLIVLSRVIPDEELAISVGFGIKTLIQTLAVSKDSDVQELGCDCIARLCHSKAGIANAMISFGIVDILCSLMISYLDSVKGTAAVAVEYLSHYPEARRQILQKCRRDPYLMRVIRFYNEESKINPDFLEGWQHYKRIGLPKIQINRPCLTVRKELDLFKDLNERQITLFSNSDKVSKMGSFTERKILTKFPQVKRKSDTFRESIYPNPDIIPRNSGVGLPENIEENHFTSNSKQVSFSQEEVDPVNG